MIYGKNSTSWTLDGMLPPIYESCNASSIKGDMNLKHSPLNTHNPSVIAKTIGHYLLYFKHIFMLSTGYSGE